MKFHPLTVADPGFPVGGGVDLVGAGVDSRGGYVLKILYVKTKESGPLGGHVLGICLCRSANGMTVSSTNGNVITYVMK